MESGLAELRLWYIKKAALFSWLDEEEQQELARRSEMKEYRRSSRFYFADEPSEAIFLIKQGRIKLLRTSAEGREVILDILGPGEIFGELALTGERYRSHSAEAVDDALVCIVRRKDFEALLERHPEMALRVLKLVGLRRRELEMRLEDLVFQPLARRLAVALLREAKRHGGVGADGRVRLRLTQTDLANLVGASREAVAEQLGEMKREGWLETSYRTVKLKDPRALQEFITEHPAAEENAAETL